jgi:hypothetical protein
VNISCSTPLIDELERRTGLPLGNYYLGKGDIDRIVSYRLRAGRTFEEITRKSGIIIARALKEGRVREAGDTL